MKARCLQSLRALTLFLLVAPGHSYADIRWHWEDRFSAEEQAMLTTWITQTVAAVEDLVAPFPFDVDIHFYRLADRGEPVPWANTRRSRAQGVNFHVDPSFPLESYYADWTAPHELSHLLIPFLGKEHSWFAEGFASYMQYSVMRHMGVMDTPGVVAAYRQRMARADASYALSDTPMAVAAGELRRTGQYPTYYWGGAIYFLQADTALRRRGGDGLPALLGEYVACCRQGDAGISRLVQAFDRLAGTPLFSELLQEFRDRPGFPDYREALEELNAQLESQQAAIARIR